MGGSNQGTFTKAILPDQKFTSMLRFDDLVKDRHLFCRIRAVQNANRVVHRFTRSTISQPADDLLPSSITITTDYSA
jgi:hypothetical protein